jgi:hypothetical protein
MQKPITSRVKRSPFLKYSPAKQTKDPKAKRYGSEEGEDEIIEKEVKTPKKSLQEAYKDRGAEYKDLSFEEYSKKAKADPLYGTSGGTKKVKKTVKGEDLDYDTTIMTTKKEGTMLEPWEVRRQLRAKTRADRQVNKKRRKMGKYGTFDKEGKFTAKEGLSQRELRKLGQAKSGYEAASDMTKNVSTGIKSGRAAGESYYQGQREKDKGEQDEAFQLEEAKRVAKKARRDDIAAASGITTSQAAGAIEANQTPFSGMMETAKELGEVDLYKPGQYSAGMPMKPSAFKMKAKSPAAKKLQGNQSRLPQHLQDSIKAAPESPAKIDPMTMMMVANAVKSRSSNKMRSGFKMKGYGKK